MNYKEKVKESLSLLEQQKDYAEHFHNKEVAKMEEHIKNVRELVAKRKSLLKEKGDKWYYYEFIVKEESKQISDLLNKRLVATFGD